MIEKMLTAQPISVALVAIVLLVWLMIRQQNSKKRAAPVEHPRTEPDPYLTAFVSRMDYHAKRVHEMASMMTAYKLRQDATEARVAILEAGHAANSREVASLSAQVEGLCSRVDHMREENREDFKGINERLDTIILSMKEA